GLGTITNGTRPLGKRRSGAGVWVVAVNVRNRALAALVADIAATGEGLFLPDVFSEKDGGLSVVGEERQKTNCVSVGRNHDSIESHVQIAAVRGTGMGEAREAHPKNQEQTSEGRRRHTTIVQNLHGRPPIKPVDTREVSTQRG